MDQELLAQSTRSEVGPKSRVGGCRGCVRCGKGTVRESSQELEAVVFGWAVIEAGTRHKRMVSGAK